MRSIVIISPLSNELQRIRTLWMKKNVNLKIAMVTVDRLTIDLGNEYVIIDYLDNGKELYDTSDLSEFILDNFYFYNIIYSDKKILVDFVFSSSFSEECFIDNDHGCIFALNKLSRNLLLNIVE